MADFDQLPVRSGTLPMEAKLVDALPQGDGWQFEPKWDGFRCLAFKSGQSVNLQSKAGKPLDRYFPEISKAVQCFSCERIVVDGELVIPVGESLSFDALQLRLHPAKSRVRKLAAETPAVMIVFDCLVSGDGQDLAALPLSERRSELTRLLGGYENPAFLISPATLAKRIDSPYLFGERAMLKVKQLRTADCVVGGFRYAASGGKVGSLLLGLYNDEGKLDHVGFTSAIPAGEREGLAKRLEGMIEPPGFTGNAPGGPSRWATDRSAIWYPLRPELVVEVRYDHVTGNRFRHGTKFLRWRPGKAPLRCRFDQLQVEKSPFELLPRIGVAQ